MNKWISCLSITTAGKPCKNKGRAHRRNLCDVHWHAKSNPDRHKRPSATGRERKLFSPSERKEVIKTYGTICYLCQREIDLSNLWHIDHVKPFSKYGSDNIENLRPTHVTCNQRKGAKNINLIKLAQAQEKRTTATAIITPSLNYKGH